MLDRVGIAEVDVAGERHMNDSFDLGGANLGELIRHAVFDPFGKRIVTVVPAGPESTSTCSLSAFMICWPRPRSGSSCGMRRHDPESRTSTTRVSSIAVISTRTSPDGSSA